MKIKTEPKACSKCARVFAIGDTSVILLTIGTNDGQASCAKCASTEMGTRLGLHLLKDIFGGKQDE